jgi:hypothetical protein
MGMLYYTTHSTRRRDSGSLPSRGRHNVTTCSLQILPLLFTPPFPLNPPLFIFPSLICLPRDYRVSCPKQSGPVSGKESIFLVLKFCSLRLVRNSSWSDEPGPSYFWFSVTYGLDLFFCVIIIYISFYFIIFLDFLVPYIFQWYFL